MNTNKEDDRDLQVFEQGKYLYKSENGKFDIDKFNRSFLQYKERRKKEMQQTMQDKLKTLNNFKKFLYCTFVKLFF